MICFHKYWVIVCSSSMRKGKGYDSDILIKDRYTNFWVMNNKLQVIWEGSCKTGSLSLCLDIDNDGKDELAIGYSLYDDNGKQLWCLDNKIDDHADGVAIVKFKEDPKSDRLLCILPVMQDMSRVDPEGQYSETLFYRTCTKSCYC